MQTSPSILGQVCTTSLTTILGSYSVGTASVLLFTRPYCVLSASWFAHVSLRFFEHVQNSPTSAKKIKIASRPYRFLLRSVYLVQVRTASDRFYIDVVETWSSVTGV